MNLDLRGEQFKKGKIINTLPLPPMFRLRIIVYFSRRPLIGRFIKTHCHPHPRLIIVGIDFSFKPLSWDKSKSREVLLGISYIDWDLDSILYMLLVMTQEAQKMRTQSWSVVRYAPFIVRQWMDLEIYLDKDIK